MGDMQILATYTGWKEFGGVHGAVEDRADARRLAVLRSRRYVGQGESSRCRDAGARTGAGRRPRWTRRRRTGRRSAARPDGHVRKARRRRLPAHDRTRQLRLGDRGVQGLHHDARGRTVRSARPRVHRRNEEADPQQADPLRHEHPSARRSHGRAAAAGGRRRDHHHAEEQRGVPRQGAQHAADAAERHARQESEEGEDRSRDGEEGLLGRDAHRRAVSRLAGAAHERDADRVPPEGEGPAPGRLLAAGAGSAGRTTTSRRWCRFSRSSI